MASLNTSANGPSITSSYKSIVNAPPPTGAAASSGTYAQWAVYAVSAPLANAFQQDSANKESTLKVQSTGEGELVDLIDEFSDGRIQFAYVKVKDTNTGLPKYALIGWCGEGVPEQTKGYFVGHSTAVSKLLHGYHVQITARSDRDLTPESIIQKVADASGSKYSAGGPPPLVASTKPIVAAKPAFTPTQLQSSGGYNIIGRPRVAQVPQNIDEDGWGEDAPPVTRTQLEKVGSAYQPTKVDIRELTSQAPTSSSTARGGGSERPGVIGGGYQPIGKVDIAEIRRQAREGGNERDERPETVRGSYEPVGKVDIAAIRAKAQPPSDFPSSAPEPAADLAEIPQSKSLAERSAAFSQPERLTSLPKPKVAPKFGGSSFTGTKAPLPGGFEVKAVPTAAPVGLTSRTFADQGGKTPAQIWAEKKARERGASGSEDAIPGQAPMKDQTSGDGGWKSGYSGKSWAPVQTTYTGRSGTSSVEQQRTGDLEPTAEEPDAGSPAGGVGALRDRFSGAAPMGAPATGLDRPAPEPDTSNKPNRGIPIPGLPQSSGGRDMPTPPPQPRSPTPPTPEMRSASPIRVAVPVSRDAVTDAHDEQMSPPPVMPVRSLDRAVPEPEDEEPDAGRDPARAAAQSTATASVGAAAAESAVAATPAGGQGGRAKAEYDYEAAEDNEVSLREGEIVTNVEKVDLDWWVVTNEQGQSGLVPSNYLNDVDEDEGAPTTSTATHDVLDEAAKTGGGVTATALYDYEAAEDNEISFQENEKISDIDKVDPDWYLGTNTQGHRGLFPGNYVSDA